METQRTWEACKECSPWAKLPNRKLLTQGHQPVENSGSICEEIIRLKKKKNLQVEHFILKVFSHETKNKGGVILLET